MIPRLLRPEELPAAGALAQVRGGTGLVLGPALGGGLIAVAGPAG